MSGSQRTVPYKAKAIAARLGVDLLVLFIPMERAGLRPHPCTAGERMTTVPPDSRAGRGTARDADGSGAFAALNIGETLGDQLIKKGQFPIEVLRLGRAFRVRKAELLTYLGLAELVAAEVQSPAMTTHAPGVQPGAPSEQPTPTHASK
ncbi:hypothetical protein SALBM135S_02770 [Streptomyces alboniger]